MNFKEYQDFYTEHQKNYKLTNHLDSDYLLKLSVMSLGLVGEAGEVSEVIKKYIRDGNLNKELLKAELGDVLAYISNLCDLFGFTLEEVAEASIKKNKDRATRNVLQGAGNNR
jgi:NTP pyrophosphatase (non-canonical NTP hydrolase)